MPDAFLSRPKGYQQITSLSAATALTVPDPDSAYAVIIAEAQSVRWRDDGIPPTASVGMLLPAGSVMTYDGPLDRIRFIETTAGATLSVSYYS